MLSDEAVASMVSALGAAGYSAVDYYGNCNMQNPEALAAFGEAVSAGNDAQAGYFVVHPDGLVHEEVLIYRSGAASVVTVSMQWDDKTCPRYTPPDSTALRAYATPKTAGSYTAAAAPNANANKYSMVRVKTYDADRRALCRRYLTPVGYSENNLFTSSWNTGNWGELDFNSLYAKFTACITAREPLTYNNAGTSAGLAAISGAYMHLVPTEQFERVMEGYLDISGDTPRARSDTAAPRRVLFPSAPSAIITA